MAVFKPLKLFYFNFQNNPGPSKSLPSEEQLPYLLKFDGTTANIIPQLGVPEIVKPSSNEKANALKSVKEKEIHPFSPKLNKPVSS